MGPLHDHLAAALGRSAADAELALATLVADIHARCRTYGEAAYPGLGTFRLGPDGMGFEPDPALAIVVNHRFTGLGAMPAADAIPAWQAPAAPVFVPLSGAQTLPSAQVPDESPPPVAMALPPPTPEPSRYAPPAPAPDTDLPADVPPVPPDPPDPPARSRRLMPALMLGLFVLLLSALLWWASTEWPRTSPPAPSASTATRPAPDTAQARTDTTTRQSAVTRDSARSIPPPVSAPPEDPRTDRPEVPVRLDAAPPPPTRRTPPASSSRTTPAPRAAVASPPRTTAPAVPPPPSDTGAANPIALRALRGQDPIEPGQGGWTVVIGGAASEADAEAQARRLRLQGYRTGVLRGTTAQGTERYRIGIGHFRTVAEAQAALSRYRGAPFPADAWLLRLD